MPIVQISLLLLLISVFTVVLAARWRLPIEVLLLIGSLLISEIPGLPTIALRPDIVFILFMPPILFAAAYFTSWRDFKANRRPIALLAIGLVLFTSAAVAVVLKWLIPQLPWAAGFVLGAMVSPPDASAATAITRKLGVPRRLSTILEGESLVNDASALIIYRFAIAALATGDFSLGSAALQFVLVAVGGAIVGWAVGGIGIVLSKHIEETTAQTLLSFLTAFGAYLIGEALGVSGVISTVAAGLYFGRWIPAQASAQLRLDAKASWDFVLFIINAFVFMLIGFQLPLILKNLSSYPPTTLLIYGSTVSAAVILIRFLWVFPATYVPRWIFPSIARKDPAPSWRVVTILSWTGMRGIVSLAASLALPQLLPNGEVFPHRDLLIFLTYAVILTTLLLPSLTLPTILRRLGIKAGNEHRREELLARVSSIQAVLNALDRMQGSSAYPPHHVADLRKRYERRKQIYEANLQEQAFTPLFDEDQLRRRLMRDVLKHEREALVRLRDGNQIHNEVFSQVVRELDLEELRLYTQRF